MNEHYLIYGHGGSYNHGGEAITRCTIAFLRSISPECRITLCSHFPDQDMEFSLITNELITRNPSGKTYDEIYTDAICKITSKTVCIHVGGDNYCYPNWQRYAAIHYAALRRGAKSILWSCSVDPYLIDDEMLMALRTHHLITTRECVTYNALIERGLTNIVKVSDIAFTLEPEAIKTGVENFVAVNLSPLIVRKNPVVLTGYKALIEYVLKKTDLNIALIPHVVMPMDNDYDVLRELYSMDSGRIDLVSDKLSAAQYKNIISKARFCVAARTHVCIAAYSACVPVLAVGYSSKAVGIARDLGLEDYVVDALNMTDTKEFLNNFKSLLEHEEDIHRHLAVAIPNYSQRELDPIILGALR
ncbi:polysaccharide pyruvyl transferase family protein [Desulfitobacterium hafniense]|uniref:polysaccharide pyruvyl transferase family protein n=1 Tax=Desulfitobacterium hafniense TaxID=49338 RepID=UPI0003734865|nr:polysaccharide pyruvyl transferase family protein [Desulfitobacterium hafniense]